MTTHIRIKRAYEAPGQGDGRRFLVDRLWPRGVRKEAARLDAWLKEAGPSTELRTWFGHEPSRWPEFQRRFRAELDELAPSSLAPLAEAVRSGDPITLVFGAKDTERNNAVVLRQFLLERFKEEEQQGGSSRGSRQVAAPQQQRDMRKAGVKGTSTAPVAGRAGAGRGKKRSAQTATAGGTGRRTRRREAEE